MTKKERIEKVIKVMTSQMRALDSELLLTLANGRVSIKTLAREILTERMRKAGLDLLGDKIFIED